MHPRVSQLDSISVLDLECCLGPVVCNTRRRVQGCRAVTYGVHAACPACLLHRWCHQSTHFVEICVIWCDSTIVSPGIEDVLTITVEGQISLGKKINLILPDFIEMAVFFACNASAKPPILNQLRMRRLFCYSLGSNSLHYSLWKVITPCLSPPSCRGLLARQKQCPTFTLAKNFGYQYFYFEIFFSKLFFQNFFSIFFYESYSFFSPRQRQIGLFMCLCNEKWYIG